MSRILLSLLIILCFSFSSNAQFNKGDILLGGTLSYSHNKGSDPNSYPQGSTANYGIFGINIGKAIKENTIAGINLSFSPSSYDNYYSNSGGSLEYSNNAYNLGVFYRLYKNLGKDFSFFGEAGIGYQGSTQSGKDSVGKKVISGSSNGGNLYFYPGISYRISKRFFLELTIPSLFFASYTTTKTTPEGLAPAKTDAFRITTSLSSNPLDALGIGFRLIL